MAQTSPVLARRVRAALEKRGMSPRDAALQSRGHISHMTINEMTRGVVPSPRKLVAFALTIGEHPDSFLDAAGEPFRYVGELDIDRVTHSLAALA